jgi:hypothetical protein
MRSITLVLLTTLPVLAAGPNFFPLQTGNEWVYSVGGVEELTIRVGAPLARDGKIFYYVAGYADQKVWIRRAENGNLFFIDPNTDQERPMTLFEVVPGGWFSSGIPQFCQLEGQAQAQRQDYQPMSGADSSAALVIRYRAFGCLPEQVEEERYVENLGLVFRRIGNVEYKLISARVGAIDFHAAPSRGVQLALDKATISREQPADKAMINGQLRITATPYSYPVIVKFPTLTRIEIVVRNRDGVEVYRHSDGMAELPVYKEQELGTTASFPFQFILQDKNRNPLPDGAYSVTAWLKTLSPEPQFMAETTIQVGSVRPATLP